VIEVKTKTTQLDSPSKLILGIFASPTPRMVLALTIGFALSLTFYLDKNTNIAPIIGSISSGSLFLASFLSRKKSLI